MSASPMYMLGTVFGQQCVDGYGELSYQVGGLLVAVDLRERSEAREIGEQEGLLTRPLPCRHPNGVG